MSSNLRATYDEDSDDNEEINKENHEKLLQNIGVSLKESQPKVNNEMRTEPSKSVSLFSISQINKKGKSTKLKLHQLMKTVKKSDSNIKLKKKIDKVELPSEQLIAPLPKPIADRIQRKVEYKKTSSDVSKWDQIVKKHRRAEHLSFPINQEPFQIKTVDAFFKPKSNSLTPLEKEMYALLSNNKYAERPDHELTLKEEEILASMNLSEAKAKLTELRKHRALLSYQQARNHRQKKIKSKNYRRMVRKQKAKGIKNLSVVEDSTLLDMRRAEERASLRHRSGSKWTKKLKRMAKHNENTKLLMEEQKHKHNELMKKQPQVVETDEEKPELNKFYKSTLVNNSSTVDSANSSFEKSNLWVSDTKLNNTDLQPKTFSAVPAISLHLQKPTLINDNDPSSKDIFEEAFVDEDLEAEFQAEVTEKNSKNNESGENSIPGWGTWVGSGIVVRKKRKRKKPYRKEEKKDLKLGHVILNEKRDAFIAKHQVHRLPFPFNKRDHFENFIAKPIGSTWNTPEVFSAAIKPNVSAPIGTIIPPMDSNEVFSK